MFDATCSKCGVPTQVPFQPTEGRPVYCQEHFREARPERRGNFGGGPRSDRPMYDATCATCNAPIQVPFRPTEGRPVYCREHFQKNRA
jgi:CxxC-x17-CxxC domain-containing protein